MGFVSLLLVVTLLSACSPDKGFETAELSRSEFGASWPFSADTGTLACEPGRVPTITFDGNTVGLEDPDLSDAIWADSATMAAASDIRDRALGLCD